MSAALTPEAFDVTLCQLRDGTMLVSMVGDLDSYAVARLRAGLGDIPPGTDALFDLSEVPFLDSAGLGALIAGVRRVRETGGRASVCSSRVNVVRLLRITGFEQIAPVYPSVEAALLAHVREVPPQLDSV